MAFGTDHLLLALTAVKEGIHHLTFTNAGILPDEVRDETLNLLGAGAEEDSPSDQARTAEEVDSPPLVLLLDPGTATAEEIGQLLFEFSTLYRMLGGSGITFTTTTTMVAWEPAFA